MRVFLATPVSFIKVFGFFSLLFLITLSSVHAKIQISSNVDPIRTNSFVRDLREKTGLKSLRLDGKNFLVFDSESEILAGSNTMRGLIRGAIKDSKNTFQITDLSGSPKIHFSQTDQGTVDVETGKTKYLVKFDFEDFEKSRRYSSDEALGSFSLGINLFHEIDHKVSYDPADPIPVSGVRPDKSSPEARGVIENTNLVRRELGLIPRDTKSRFGFRYKGLVGSFRNTFQILFRSDKGRRKFLRWRVDS